jgi:hypothetical protein
MTLLQHMRHFLANEGRVIREAPGSFTIACVSALLISWFVVSQLYSLRSKNKDSLIETRDATIKYDEALLANYREKLKGASPEEAAGQIQKLNQEISSLKREMADVSKKQRSQELADVDKNKRSQSGRRLSDEEKRKFANAARLFKNVSPVIEIAYDGNCIDCNRYSTDFVDLLSNIPGWRVSGNGMMVGIRAPSNGILVRVENKRNLSAAARAIIGSLNTASIQYTLSEGLSKSPERQISNRPQASVKLIVTGPNN